MGWSLAGFACDSGSSRRAPAVSPKSLDWARKAAREVAQSCGVERIDRTRLEAWRQDRHRTLYLFDVRDPAEYQAGHVRGAISAPGGQLVQATDQYVGTLGARIVLVDDAEVRAAMTASWLRQMGFSDVSMLVETGSETSSSAATILDGETDADTSIDLASLAALFSRDAATIVDLSLSRDYLAGHIPGAWFAIRTRLDRALPKIPLRGTLVLTSEDGCLARLAVAEAQALVEGPVRFLAGGNAAWRAAGYDMSSEAAMADDAVDQWRKPYERSGDVRAAMNEYLTWEIDLLPRIERDGTLRFRIMGA
jgi:rhodanese-related sulfurtransferase